MKSCEYCKIETEEPVCPECYALIPQDNCHIPANPICVKTEINGAHLISGVFPIIAALILLPYKGSAWFISLIMGAFNVICVTILEPSPKTHLRSLYYVLKLLHLPAVQLLFRSKEDFKRCYEFLAQLSQTIPPYHVQYVELTKILKQNPIHDVLLEELHITSCIPYLPALFELIATQQHAMVVTMNPRFQDHPEAFKEVIFSPRIQSFVLTKSSALVFNNSLWRIQKEISLKELPNLHRLPEYEDVSVPITGLHFICNECGLMGLPYSLPKRTLLTLDLEKCQNLSSLPESLKMPLRQGRIPRVNFMSTGIKEDYRKLFTNMAVLFPDEIFKDVPSAVYKKEFQFSLGLGELFIPCGILAMLLSKIVYPHQKDLPTENAGFWTILVVMAAGTGLVSSTIQVAQKQPKLRVLKNNIDAVYNILQKSGAEHLSPTLSINWDHVWRAIFTQDSPEERPVVPKNAKRLIEAWIKARDSIITDPLSAEMARFIKAHGGFRFARRISNLPLGEMLALLNQKALDYPLIQEALKEHRNYIGIGEEASITLALSQLLNGYDNQFMELWAPYWEAISALAQSGRKIKLTLDWLYLSVFQTLDFAPSEALNALYIKNATIIDITPNYWLVAHALGFENCKHFLRMPKPPEIMPRSPLALTFINCPIRRLPDNIAKRQFKEIVVIKCPNLYFFPDDLQIQITRGVLKKIVIKECGIQSKKEIYDHDDSVAHEAIFEDCPLEPVVPPTQSWLNWFDAVKWSVINWLLGLILYRLFPAIVGLPGSTTSSSSQTVVSPR